MRRAELIWHYTAIGTAWTDITQSLGDGSAPVTLAQNDKLYIGHSDWLSGLLLFVSNPGTPPLIVPETFDAITGTWRPLPVQERVDQASIGHTVVAAGYPYAGDGMVVWGRSPYLWQRLAAQAGFPEPQAPPQAYECYWVRLRNTGTTPLVISRLLPQLYNTYATADDVANFLGIEAFSDEASPTASRIKRAIRTAETWLEKETRRSWRPTLILNEHHPLNIWGTKLNRFPIWFVCRAILWNYNATTALVEGRAQDYFISRDTNLVQFNTIGLGLMPIFGKLASAYFRQQEPLEIDYVYGDDFDTHDLQDLVHDTVLRKVAADVVEMADFAPVLLGNPEFSKPEKLKSYLDRAQDQADRMRRFVMA